MTQEFIEVLCQYDNEHLQLINSRFVINLTVKSANPRSLPIKTAHQFPEKTWYIEIETSRGENYILNPVYESEHDAVSEALNIFSVLNVEE